ncbi:hypothetical protein OG874_22210 [Nocardia sp. NBC_00565]|uniref:hypothetical protein n=1 Tax=Nocardia sp. NBC_00565 TaxID=2975993 RepID=UPI002E8067DC|nr:hypothetical protein [Nocardia sp. NBC_00565]WUC07632.1 hypothetical protein OG874_22210 [Nocardia sp. NBC_00565]
MNLKSKKVVIAATVAGALVITPAAMAIQSTIAAPGNHSNGSGGGARGGGYGNSSRTEGSRRVSDQDHGSSTAGSNSNYDSRGDNSGRWVWVPGEGR